MGFSNIITCGFTQITACNQPTDRENHPDYNLMKTKYVRVHK
jgi:hypothetical protein